MSAKLETQNETGRRYAAVTMVRDEDVFLKTWVDYYAAQFGAENLYIIDHNSAQLPVVDQIGPGPNVIRLPIDDPVPGRGPEDRPFDPVRLQMISAQVRALLNYYDCVVVGDADEIYIVDDGNQDLRSYLDAQPDIGLRAGVGVELYHDWETEGPFDPAQAVLDQRAFFRYRMNYCKPWIVGDPGVELTVHGSHQGFMLDPKLILLHLHFLDRDLLIDRQAQRLRDYAEGRGGNGSRWKDKVDEALHQMGNVQRQSVLSGDMPHREFLEEMFPGYEWLPISPDNFPRHKRKGSKAVMVDHFITDEQRKDFLVRKYRFPERFRGKV